jgi:hypothetical protein
LEQATSLFLGKMVRTSNVSLSWQNGKNKQRLSFLAFDWNKQRLSFLAKWLEHDKNRLAALRVTTLK